MSVIAANNLRKRYRDVHALDGLSFNVEPGQITGLIGPNGSGKTTAINAILGLNTLDSGELSVLGMNPATQRAQLMTQVAYIADTGILPKWMKVKDMLDFVGRVQPTFNREVAEAHLAKTDIRANKTIQTLSKGMHVQLHLAVVLAIDAPLLVLDEPTLGLDVLYRQRFYDAILNDYFTTERSILVTTHEVREIEHILTNVVLLGYGVDAQGYGVPSSFEDKTIRRWVP
ncbi:MAG: ABC transporter ATP-binding protein, partial [Pseudomonadota bacterium]